ncbi:MAG: hypothetical protein ACK4F8_11615 [Aquabacterium sp.]
MPNEPTRTFTLELRESLFNAVKDNLRSGVTPPREFTDQEAMAFLAKHPRILGSIVHFDEVDTTDREAIWDAQRDEAANAASR